MVKTTFDRNHAHHLAHAASFPTALAGASARGHWVVCRRQSQVGNFCSSTALVYRYRRGPCHRAELVIGGESCRCESLAVVIVCSLNHRPRRSRLMQRSITNRLRAHSPRQPGPPEQPPTAADLGCRCSLQRHLGASKKWEPRTAKSPKRILSLERSHSPCLARQARR